jgi:hypothetical protein
VSVLRFKPSSKGNFAGIPFELPGGPWFGPRKRGRQLLEAPSTRERDLTREEFITYLKTELPHVAASIELIKFYSYREEDSGDPWNVRFAICHMLPRFEPRKKLFEDGPRITSATGWYPLVMGRRLRDRRHLPMPKIRRVTTLWDTVNPIRLGEIVEVRSLHENPDGNSIVVQFEHASLLLDFGFNCRLGGQPKPSLAILSHNHADHVGGIRDVLKAGVPVLLNESVYWQLLDQNKLSADERRLCFPVTFPSRFFTKDRAEIKLISGAHSPGAMMVLLTMPSGDQLLYPGDYCLRNAYYQLKSNDLLRHFSPTAGKRFLLVDGTFLGYNIKDESHTSLDELASRLSALYQACTSTVFFAQSADYLYTLYIWLFGKFYSGGGGHDRSLVIDTKLQYLLDSTFADIFFRLRGRRQKRDPFINAVLGKGETAYVESARLYPLDNGRIPRSMIPPYDVLCNMEQVQRFLPSLPPETAFFAVGRRDKRMLTLCADLLGGRDLAYLDGSDFTFHSRPEDVAAIVRTAASNGVMPIVFHNYPHKTREALSALGIDESLYQCLRLPAASD